MSLVFSLDLLIFTTCLSYTVGQLYKGDACVTRNTNENGICTSFVACPSTVDDLRKGIYPTQCGFEGNDVIVCCPQRSKPQSRQPGEIANTKCQEYSQYVWTEELSPTLLVGAGNIKKKECPFDKLELLVVGGTPATRKEFPHMVQLGYVGTPIQWACGGSLISERFVLTAAHCLDDRALGEALFARMGITDLDNPDHMQQFNITERIAHPNYEDPSHYNDIGLAKLHQKVSFNTWVRPACLYSSSNSPWSKVIATGWGKTDFAGYESTVLLRVILELYDQPRCNKVYKHESGTNKLLDGIKDELMVCAGHSKEFKDTCQGDSGGPLQVYKTESKNTTCMYDIVGVTSFGKGCGLAVNIPGVYTRVSNYVKWIEDHVWPI